jgi:hypothetical protein
MEAHRRMSVVGRAMRWALLADGTYRTYRTNEESTHRSYESYKSHSAAEPMVRRTADEQELVPTVLPGKRQNTCAA